MCTCGNLVLGGICSFLKNCWVEELCGNTWIAVFMLHLRWSAYLASFAFLISLIMLTFYICYCNCTEICTYERALQYNMASLQITVSRHIKLKSRTRWNLNIIIVYQYFTFIWYSIHLLCALTIWTAHFCKRREWQAIIHLL